MALFAAADREQQKQGPRRSPKKSRRLLSRKEAVGEGANEADFDAQTDRRGRGVALTGRRSQPSPMPKMADTSAMINDHCLCINSLVR
jgi:hypothetical protein